MHPALVIGYPSYRIVIRQLKRVPEMEVLRISSDEITTRENVEYACDEAGLLPQGDCTRIRPSSTESVNRVAHAVPVFV